MPLHLLGKKSWNVYNADNIAKVKRDEAAAAAREEGEEQRMQEVDAERRIQILRGLPFEAPRAPIEEERNERSRENRPDRERKRKRIAGEDDTDRDIRFAQENNALVPAKAEMQMKTKKSSDAPITDVKGHINLFPVDGTRHNAPKNAEVEAEKAKKQKEFEDQYTMRFSNAAGFKQAIGQKPWYHKINAVGDERGEVEAPSKDVWGNEDPRRKEREKIRTVADDPLSAIQKGVAGVREVERERKKWTEEKGREIRELEEAERRRERRRRRREADDVEGFRLDDGAKPDEPTRRHHGSKDDSSPHSHRRRSRSPDRSGHRSHHHRHRPVIVDNRTGWEVGPGGRYSSQFAHA
ncbi:hypothetical protein HO173_006582 [Letharia columbiana]|uniref:CBF1-interacting co-repressor CIR N-terminal domain-containing protein n=1 Tax=Letharia columbiana TaxID=112416 RepID=A0A8H6FVA0_9LECA|nr:uncharacterized protein HO173_006582 [Letharia columbiana]KAF6235386.1 hypothetical protein HO173_006582 [Letharia columbiana]